MTERKIRLVVSDMDGTLLAPDRHISRAVCDAVAAAEERGIRFSICTGRVEPMTKSYQRTLKLRTPMITANGALIWDPVAEKTLWDCPMDEAELLAFLRFCKEQHLDYCALTMQESYFSRGNVRRQRFEQYNRIAAEEGVPPMRLEVFDEDFACIRGKKVYKMLIYEVAPGQLALAVSFLKQLHLTGYTSSEDRLLDVARKEVNKGLGLVNLARILDIPREEVCAVGDFDNDIPMLEQAGYPVAMENGCEAIRKKAAFVTRSNAEDGVAWLLGQL